MKVVVDTVQQKIEGLKSGEFKFGLKEKCSHIIQVDVKKKLCSSKSQAICPLKLIKQNEGKDK